MFLKKKIVGLSCYGEHLPFSRCVDAQAQRGGKRSWNFCVQFSSSSVDKLGVCVELSSLPIVELGETLAKRSNDCPCPALPITKRSHRHQLYFSRPTNPIKVRQLAVLRAIKPNEFCTYLFHTPSSSSLQTNWTSCSPVLTPVVVDSWPINAFHQNPVQFALEQRKKASKAH